MSTVCIAHIHDHLGIGRFQKDDKQLLYVCIVSMYVPTLKGNRTVDCVLS